jgi:small subunit ribosomal protein S2
MIKFTVVELLNKGVHIGHSKRLSTYLFDRYLVGYRHGVALIDLQQSAFMLRRALAFVTEVVSKRGTVLFVDRLMKKRTRMFYGHLFVKRGWITGGLTNMSALSNNFNERTSNFLPSAIVLLSEDKNKYYLFNEARKLGIPSVGIIDSNMSPGLATFPIAGNNDTVGSVKLYLALFRRAVLWGVLKDRLEFGN